MMDIPDDPIISAMERTGYPPRIRYSWWAFSDWEEEEETDEEEDDPIETDPADE